MFALQFFVERNIIIDSNILIYFVKYLCMNYKETTQKFGSFSEE